MLLSKTVKMKWNPKNKDWYKSKGYIFNMWGDEFNVRIEDLTHGSTALVNVKCDCEECKNPFLKPMEYSRYLKCIKSNGEYYCKTCASEERIEHSTKTKLNNTISFEQWCVENNRQDVLNRWDCELNDKKPSEISYGTKEKYYFKCERNLHDSEVKLINSFTSGWEGSITCNKCNSIAQFLIDEYGESALELYWDYDKNNKLGLNPWSIGRNSMKAIWLKCINVDYHESYNMKCHYFAYNNCRCPYCARKKIHPFDSLGKLLEDKELLHLWSKKNKKSPYEYFPMSGKYAFWKCINENHEDYRRQISTSVIYEFRCPACSRERDESFLQKKVRLYLEDLKYTILHEYNCNVVAQNPKSKKGHMPYDNEVEELRLIIEVHGQQHYKESCGFFKNSLSLQKRQLYDRYKRIYAKCKGYNYLEIPYWTDDKKETWKKLIDNKIREITHKENTYNQAS